MTTTARENELITRREAIYAEINAMPAAKNGSPYHLDRIDELKRIAAELGR